MKPADMIKRLEKTGRNETCPCGSGKKYKHCHLREDEEVERKEYAKKQATEKKESSEKPTKEGPKKDKPKNPSPASFPDARRTRGNQPARQFNLPRKTGGG